MACSAHELHTNGFGRVMQRPCGRIALSFGCIALNMNAKEFRHFSAIIAQTYAEHAERVLLGSEEREVILSPASKDHIAIALTYRELDDLHDLLLNATLMLEVGGLLASATKS